jgi:hypothetical protein
VAGLGPGLQPGFLFLARPGLIGEILCEPKGLMGIDKNTDANAMEVLSEQISSMPIIGRLFSHHRLMDHQDDIPGNST